MRVKLKNQDYSLNLILCLVFGLIGFLFSLGKPLNNTTRLLIFFLPFGLFPFLLLNTYLLRRSHSKVLDKGSYRKFSREFKLTKENRGEYFGLRGSFGNYFLRLYWDPYYYKNGAMSFLIYYDRPVNLSGSLDFIRINKINKELQIQKSLLNRKYHTSHVKLHLQGKFSRFKNVSRLLLDTVESIENQGLVSISELEVEKLIQEAPYEHGPLIDTFQDNFKSE